MLDSDPGRERGGDRKWCTGHQLFLNYPEKQEPCHQLNSYSFGIYFHLDKANRGHDMTITVVLWVIP